MKIPILLIAVLTGTDPVTEPISPAKGGMLQCHSPDDTKKTCQSLAGYKAQADGSFINDATILIAPEPVVTLQTSSVVRVKGNAICGVITDEEIKASKLFLDGQQVPDGRAGPIRVEIGGAMASFIGKEICTTYTPGDKGLLVANATVGGVARPELQQNVRWVYPQDGYRVAP